jgi:hypothetical protein
VSDQSSQGPASSDTAPPAPPASDASVAQAMLAQDQEAPQATPPQQAATPEPQVQESQEPTLSDFAQGVLKDIPDAERAIVAKYLSKWDAGVTRRFQEVQSTWGPLQQYVDQGVDVSEMETALRLYQLLDEDPEAAANIIAQATGLQFGSGPQETPAQQVPNPQQQQPSAAQIAQLPPEIQQQLQQTQQFQQQFAQWWQTQQQEAAQAQEDAQLESYLSNLKTEKGDFDEKFVLSRMAAGVDGATAVDEWNASLENFAKEKGLAPASSAPPAPAVLSGGPAPVGTASVVTASDQERKALVAQMLDHAKGS